MFLISDRKCVFLEIFIYFANHFELFNNLRRFICFLLKITGNFFAFSHRWWPSALIYFYNDSSLKFDFILLQRSPIIDPFFLLWFHYVSVLSSLIHKCELLLHILVMLRIRTSCHHWTEHISIAKEAAPTMRCIHSLLCIRLILSHWCSSKAINNSSWHNMNFLSSTKCSSSVIIYNMIFSFLKIWSVKISLSYRIFKRECCMRVFYRIDCHSRWIAFYEILFLTVEWYIFWCASRLRNKFLWKMIKPWRYRLKFWF